MKKLLTLTLALIVLAAFTGLGAAQERKAGEKPLAPAAISPNTVTLSATKNMASLKGCPVTAWVGYKKLPFGGPPPVPTPGYSVTRVKVFPPGPASSWGTSDANGEVKGTISWNTTIKATVQSGPNLLTSNNFACGGPLLPEK